MAARAIIGTRGTPSTSWIEVTQFLSSSTAARTLEQLNGSGRPAEEPSQKKLALHDHSKQPDSEQPLLIARKEVRMATLSELKKVGARSQRLLAE